MKKHELIAVLSSRGWEVKTRFGGQGPVLQVRGSIQGQSFSVMQLAPCFLKDDHTPCLEGIYAQILEMSQGVSGG